MIRTIVAIAAIFITRQNAKVLYAQLNEHPDRVKASIGFAMSIGSSLVHHVDLMDWFEILVQVLGGIGGLYYLYLGIRERRLELKRKKRQNK